MTLDTKTYRCELREAVQTMSQLKDYSQALAQAVYGPTYGPYTVEQVSPVVGLSKRYLTHVLHGYAAFSPPMYLALADWFYSQERP